MAKNRVIEIRDYSNVNVFKEAAVYPVVFRVEISNNRTPVKMDVMDGMELVGNQNTISPEKFYADINWDKYFNTSAEALSIVDKMAKFPILSSIADVNGAATVGEAYLVKEFMYDDDGNDDSVMKFINTGGIDKYKSFYGIEYIRYLKGKYMYPVVKVADLKNMSVKRFNESQSEKIIIGGMNKVLECFYDDGNYLAGKSTTIVYNNPYLKVITAILNSTLMSFYYATFYNSMSLAGGFYRIGAPQIKALPIALPDDDVTIETLENLVNETKKLLKSLQESDREVQNVLKQIDNIVYKLYGLTDSEISCVEN